jgi:hypothetical protein
MPEVHIDPETTREGAKLDLAPTIEQLQASALELIDRMLILGKEPANA